jgi:hypothetical protein
MSISSSEPDLSWLADAPVFIDGQQIGAFYDAVVGRGFSAVQLRLSAGPTEQLERSAGGSVNTGSSTLFSWLKFDVGANAGRTRSRIRREGQSVVLEPVESPSMRLVQLTLHYMGNQPDRIRAVTRGTEVPGHEDISASPRMLAFIDVPPETRFLPQAAELDDGRVVTFSSALTDHWKTDEVVKVVEEVIAGGGRPRWIDYRMTFATGEDLNLHVEPRGDYDTGVFAYTMIRRGWRFGFRIVGTLKSQPALNVLAVYEK